MLSSLLVWLVSKDRVLVINGRLLIYPFLN